MKCVKQAIARHEAEVEPGTAYGTGYYLRNNAEAAFADEGVIHIFDEEFDQALRRCVLESYDEALKNEDWWSVGCSNAILTFLSHLFE
jgi:hypothetical protein